MAKDALKKFMSPQGWLLLFMTIFLIAFYRSGHWVGWPGYGSPILFLVGSALCLGACIWVAVRARSRK